jgi:hypothetical protein
MLSDLDRIAAIRAAFPPEGLFADKDWLISPEPFLVSDKLAEQLDKLGYRLQLFVRACNELYQRSVSGKQPAWIADYLDRGKPPELIEYARQKRFRDDLPQVIRPDLVLTEDGFTIAELDNVPGGIGLTQWLNTTYASFGTSDLLGGENGMLDGFQAVVGEAADIVVSDEAATYRPEMEYLARLSGGALRVHGASDFKVSSEGPDRRSLYRFFENFDLANVPCAPAIMDAAASGEIRVTPPFKPYLEEKLWFALFWLRPLREFWRRELGERHFVELQKHIPMTWVVDPTPLPQHAVIPGLEIHSWEELMRFSQKQRDLILKISGFSELGWGSRSVTLGSDAPQPEWQAALEHALASFAHHPYVLQRFHKGRLVEQPFLNPATGAIETMHGRVRLCPYYFVTEGRSRLGGALATICPADKKLLHGMKDAIMVPTAVGQ